LRLGKYDQAIADFTTVLELIPTATRSLINRGAAYMRQQRYDLAIADLTKSIEINPKEPQAYLNRGLTHLLQGENKQGILDCQKAVALEERYWNAYFCLGVAYTEEQEWDVALSNFGRAIALAPSTERSNIYCMQGATYATLGDFGSAVRSLEQGVRLDIVGHNDWCKSALENARQGIPTR
jgi:tetratricopeptide (TPR) repeat protein